VGVPTAIQEPSSEEIIQQRSQEEEEEEEEEEEDSEVPQSIADLEPAHVPQAVGNQLGARQRTENPAEVRPVSPKTVALPVNGETLTVVTIHCAK